jgi:hypothetical protein
LNKACNDPTVGLRLHSSLLGYALHPADFLQRLNPGNRPAAADQSGYDLPAPEEAEASSVVFRGFLMDSLELIGSDVILIIDPLEALPTDLVQALLTSLRAAYMDQQDRDHRVIVVVSGALSLATLTVGESSPFRGIARRVFIGDLSREDSRSLLQDLLAEQQVRTTPGA